MVIYSGPNSDPVTYPEKEEEVAAVINRYVSGSREDNAKRTLNLHQGLALGNKKNKPHHLPLSPPPPPPPIKGKGKEKAGGGGGGGAYQTWYPVLDGFNRDDLVNLCSVLDCNLRMRQASLFYNANANTAAAPGGADHGGMMMMMQLPAPGTFTVHSSAHRFPIPTMLCP